jgi:hypothetical protein
VKTPRSGTVAVHNVGKLCPNSQNSRRTSLSVFSQTGRAISTIAERWNAALLRGLITNILFCRKCGFGMSLDFD